MLERDLATMKSDASEHPVLAAPGDAEPYTDLYSRDSMAKPFQGLFARWLNSQGSSFLATLGFEAQSLWD